MTGDYDLFQVLGYGMDCPVVDQDSVGFEELKRAVNKKLKWDAIQHGPQAQWASSQEKEPEKYHDFDMAEEVDDALKTKNYGKSIKAIKGRDPMNVLDSPLTVVAGPGGVVCLENADDVATSLLCKGCGT